uniref:Post-GPI attachment to proteins factor 2 n=1 Tax=Parascaris univalens TaxID=6257 RepID=A0A915CBU6_PARUN
MSPLDLSHSVTAASATSHADRANNGAEYCSDETPTAAPAQLSPINNVSGNVKTMSITQRCSSEGSTSPNHRCSSDTSMNSDQRCGSLSPVISDNERNNDVVLFEFTFRQLMLLIIGTPLCALVASFVVGFSTDYDVLLNYEWTCGRVHLPSFSRIINMPKERLIWNVLVVFHTALRPWLVLMNYRICRSPATLMRFPRVHSALANCILVCGCTEIIFLVLLTVVGEREQSDIHVGFFVVFSLSSLIYFLLTSLMYRVSYHYVRCKQAPFSWVLKMTLAVSYLILLPTISTFFTLYWQLCYSYTYDFFATFEYLTILVNFGFHATSILDSNDLYQVRVKCSNKT